MNAKKLFKVGQGVNTLKITGNVEVQKTRNFSMVSSNEVSFEGLKGSYKMYKTDYPDIVFFQGDTQLIIL